MPYSHQMSIASDPAPVRDRLGWLASCLIGVWSALGLGLAGFHLYQRSVHSLVIDPGTGTAQPDPGWPPGVRVGVEMALFIGWVLSLNLLLPAAVIGTVRIYRLRTHRIWRAVGYGGALGAACFDTFWMFGHSVLIGAAVIAGVPLLSYAVLRPRQTLPRPTDSAALALVNEGLPARLGEDGAVTRWPGSGSPTG